MDMKMLHTLDGLESLQECDACWLLAMLNFKLIFLLSDAMTKKDVYYVLRKEFQQLGMELPHSQTHVCFLTYSNFTHWRRRTVSQIDITEDPKSYDEVAATLRKVAAARPSKEISYSVGDYAFLSNVASRFKVRRTCATPVMVRVWCKKLKYGTHAVLVYAFHASFFGAGGKVKVRYFCCLDARGKRTA